MTKEINIHKNTILYGPPGTGKTYNTIAFAVGLADDKKIFQDEKTGEITVEDYPDRESLEKRFTKLKEDNLVEFCTFHQSYSYEEFIEGIKPKVEIDETTNEKRIIYEVTDGIFKKFCIAANPYQLPKNINDITIWKISLGSNNLKEDLEEIKQDCLHNNRIRIGYGDDINTVDELKNAVNLDSSLRYFINANIGDIVLVKLGNSYKEKTALCDAIGIIRSDVKKDMAYERYTTYRDVTWIAKDIREDIYALNDDTYLDQKTMYPLSNITPNNIHNLLNKYLPKGKVFIIDEINRGNISKIFGELITLIEDTKRIDATNNNPAQGMRIRLPYSHNNNDIGFGVPDNIYILGTMNTADRSIALIDTALRRRFKFIEMAPQFSLLENIEIAEVNGNKKINIKNMMDKINERIEILYDRDHKIGHSFFMKLNNNSTINDLAEIFEYDIIPLLQEYFYNDWEKIAAILGDDFGRKDKTYNFINRLEVKDDIVRKYDMEKIYTYNLNKGAFEKAITYMKIYEPTSLNNTTQESTQDEE